MGSAWSGDRTTGRNHELTTKNEQLTTNNCLNPPRRLSPPYTPPAHKRRPSASSPSDPSHPEGCRPAAPVPPSPYETSHRSRRLSACKTSCIDCAKTP